MFRALLQVASVLLIQINFAQASSNLLDLERTQFVNGQIVIESNDAGEVVTLTAEEYKEFTGRKFLEHLVGFFNFKMSFSTVASYITPTMEREFDVFIMVNVDYQSRFNGAHEVPAQHMKVIRRTREGENLFRRNTAGRIVGSMPSALGNTSGALPSLSELMPISSGAGHFPNDGQPYVDTPTGIYRINFNKSDTRRYSYNNSGQAVMFHSLYFDLIYPWGKSSGLAIHGTNKSQYKNLGTQRSHGCIRTTQAQANSMYENLINSGNYWGSNLPDMNSRKRLKTENGATKAGVRALIVIFYGYDKAYEAYDI